MSSVAIIYDPCSSSPRISNVLCGWEPEFRLRDLHKDMLSGSLDYLAHGVVLVDLSGLPIWLNKRAQELINRFR